VKRARPVEARTVAKNRVGTEHNPDAYVDPDHLLPPVTIVLHVEGLHLQGHAKSDVQGEVGRERIGDVCYSEL
jgi:hypothetical protein